MITIINNFLQFCCLTILLNRMHLYDRHSHQQMSGWIQYTLISTSIAHIDALIIASIARANSADSLCLNISLSAPWLLSNFMYAFYKIFLLSVLLVPDPLKILIWLLIIKIIVFIQKLINYLPLRTIKSIRWLRLWINIWLVNQIRC